MASSATNILLFLGAGLFLLCFLYNLGTIIYFHTSSTFSNTPKTSVVDFWIAGVVFIVLTGYSSLTKGIKSFQSKRSSDIHNGLFCSVSAIACFALFRSQDFWPSLLGGNASVKVLFENFPSVSAYPFSTLFFMIHFGLCVYQLKNGGSDLHSIAPNAVNVFKICLFFTLFMTNNIKLFLVLAFIFSAVSAVSYIADAFCDPLDEKMSNIVKIVVWVLEVVVFVALKLVVYGIVLVGFWTAPKFSESWILKFDMIVLGVVLTGLWGLYLELLRSKVYAMKVNFQVKKMQEEKLMQAKQQ